MSGMPRTMMSRCNTLSSRSPCWKSVHCMRLAPNSRDDFTAAVIRVGLLCAKRTEPDAGKVAWCTSGSSGGLQGKRSDSFDEKSIYLAEWLLLTSFFVRLDFHPMCLKKLDLDP